MTKPTYDLAASVSNKLESRLKTLIKFRQLSMRMHGKISHEVAHYASVLKTDSQSYLFDLETPESVKVSCRRILRHIANMGLMAESEMTDGSVEAEVSG